MDDQHIERITQVAVVSLCLGIAGFIGLIAIVSFFGPQLAPLMNKLPW